MSILLESSLDASIVTSLSELPEVVMSMPENFLGIADSDSLAVAAAMQRSVNDLITENDAIRRKGAVGLVAHELATNESMAITPTPTAVRHSIRYGVGIAHELIEAAGSSVTDVDIDGVNRTLRIARLTGSTRSRSGVPQESIQAQAVASYIMARSGMGPAFVEAVQNLQDAPDWAIASKVLYGGTLVVLRTALLDGQNSTSTR